MSREHGHPRGQRQPRLSRDRGSASVFLLAVGLVLLAAGLAGAAIGAARVGRHQARTAADLGALAGAAEAIYGEQVACRTAGRFVTANGGRMAECALGGLEITVRAEVVVRPLPGLVRRAGAQARAGPVYAPAGWRRAIPGGQSAPGEPRRVSRVG